MNVKPSTKITEQAAQWFGELLDGDERRAEFFAWLAESPRHVEEFLFVLADAQDLAAVSAGQRERIEQMSRELGTADTMSSLVVPVSQRALRSYESAPIAHQTVKPSSARTRWMIGVAAAVLLAFGAVLALRGTGAWQNYSTRLGEQRSLTLADGSVVHLNTDSEVDVRLTGKARSVRLVRGEALFSVEHDAKRPFLVHSADAVIQAIGTRFDVYRRPDSTRVAVIDGVVQISNRLLAAGEGADVSIQGEVRNKEPVDTFRVIAWRQNRLVFEQDTLGDIAAEFNRYNANVKIRVIGDASTNEHFSGTFDADAPEAVMKALAGDSHLSVERIGKEIVIRSRPVAH